jgi:hypothetical protein
MAARLIVTYYADGQTQKIVTEFETLKDAQRALLALEADWRARKIGQVVMMSGKIVRNIDNKYVTTAKVR